ncbi:hypothetical protein BDA99DRAFT_492300 [Phascolomyces articulosus]|uniref:Uncharacterized protein n=1 Tax=Phascolomyces articulosus TaxID=60185 RepID=A0AAD5KBY5_9FUNG|nr:hypothetical protein BDA99DRAFT_492300 [Phascolomyces articulosus]
MWIIQLFVIPLLSIITPSYYSYYSYLYCATSFSNSGYKINRSVKAITVTAQLFQKHINTLNFRFNKSLPYIFIL